MRPKDQLKNFVVELADLECAGCKVEGAIKSVISKYTMLTETVSSLELVDMEDLTPRWIVVGDVLYRMNKSGEIKEVEENSIG